MKATIEVPITVSQVNRTIAEWESKLAAAKRTLNDYESQMGNAALLGKAGEIADGLHRLEIEVRIAEQALAAAKRQTEQAKINDKLAQIDGWRKRIEEMEASIAVDKAYVAEWQHIADKVQEAHNRIGNNEDFVFKARINLGSNEADMRIAKEKANNGQ